MGFNSGFKGLNHTRPASVQELQPNVRNVTHRMQSLLAAGRHHIILTCIYIYMSYSWVSFWWEVTWQRNTEWRHSVRRPCDTMRIRRRAYRNTIMLIRSSVLYGTMCRVASICFCIFQRCTSHRTMYMTYCTTYTWIRHDSVKAEYDIIL